MNFYFERKEIGEMTFEERRNKVKEFYNRLVDISKDHYFEVESCNNDASRYLLRNGTTREDISYYSKPLWSYRMSDHWNWYTSERKCSDLKYIQCHSIDMPWARKRVYVDKATRPMRGWQVCIFSADDGLYHCVYGEIFDRKEKKWYWVENDPKMIYEFVGQYSGVL